MGNEHAFSGRSRHHHHPRRARHPLDPSNDPRYSPNLHNRGNACKTIFDCTVPFAQKGRFVRAPFLELDPTRWVPED